MDSAQNPSGASRARPQAQAPAPPARPVPARPGTDASSHSTATHDEVFVGFRSDSTTIEQQERRIKALMDEIDRIREAASIDVTNLQTDVIAKNREIGRLKAELAKQREDEPEHDEVRNLLLLWKAETGRNKKCDISAESKRYKLAKAAHRRWGYERCEHAIRGLALKPYSGPRGRSDTEYLGAKKVCDIEHALGDETRMERCEQYWLEHVTPTLMDQPDEPVAAGSDEREPESWSRQFVRYAYGDDCQLPYVPASQERPAKPTAWLDRTPIDKVLAALQDVNSRVVAYPNRPDSWSAQCPAHEDRDPSLSIMRKPDGMVLLRCWAGCETADVLAALRLVYSDLWENNDRDHGREDGPPVRKVVPAHLRQAMAQLIDLERAA